MKVAQRVQHLIDVMHHVQEIGGNLNMLSWYSEKIDNPDDIDHNRFTPQSTLWAMKSKNVDDFHTCDTAACFAGWCAIDADVRFFISSGDYNNPLRAVIRYLENGLDKIGYYASEEAVTKYVEHTELIAREMKKIACYSTYSYQHSDVNPIYGVDERDITIPMVIEKLTEFLKVCESEEI